ncbi:MAG: hypothetical protein GEU95_20660 [Rhizobiales bacterium]|nr:hypothetical protein [Hyphomicrobiales bacterium]
MRTIDYQQRIVECRRQSETAPNVQARIIWKQMEEFWRQRALMPRPTKTFKALSFISEARPVRRA